MVRWFALFLLCIAGSCANDAPPAPPAAPAAAAKPEVAVPEVAQTTPMDSAPKPTPPTAAQRPVIAAPAPATRSEKTVAPPKARFIDLEATEGGIPPAEVVLEDGSFITQEGFEDAPPAVPPVPEPSGDELFTIAEEMPEFPGGEMAMRQFLNDHFQYPAMEKESGVQGRVYVQFVVEKDGNLSGTTVARGVSPGMNNEALRLIKAMPKWVPGRHNGQVVRVRMTVPIIFKLQ